MLLPQALRGFSQQFTVAPIVILSLGSLAPSRMKLASGLFNCMRNLGGAIGIALCGTILNHRTNLHFLRLDEHLNNTNAAMLQALRQTGLRDTALAGGDAAQGAAMALKTLFNLTMREALTLSYADAFIALVCCCVIATLMAPLMKRVAAPAKPLADAH